MYGGFRVGTAVKQEQVDDGSIFVCFLCEKEFTKIQDLNNHMKEHADPEDGESTRVDLEQDIVEIKLKEKKSVPKIVNVIQSKLLGPPKKMAKVKKNLVPPIKSSAEVAAERARKVQMYIKAREGKSNVKKPVEDDNLDNGSLFETQDLNSISGGTIIMSEPEGFICPIQEKDDKQSRKSMSSGVMMNSDTSNTNQDSLGEFTFFSEGSASKYTSSRLNRESYHQYKRGRPTVSFRQKQLYFDRDFEDGNFLAPQPGRRSGIIENSDDFLHQCPECFKDFKSLHTLKVHMRSHAENKEITCPMCQEVFPQRYILYEHIVNDHEECIEDLVCSICNKIFTRTDSLKSHMVRIHNTHGGLNCMVCGKNFPGQAQLEIHVRVHTGERPYTCMECGRGFVQKVHLKTHLRTMHNIENSLVTPCRLCGMHVQGRNNLREHYTVTHAMSTAQYRTEVMRLRREGKIPEKIPPIVKVVSPNFTYKNVSTVEFSRDQITPSSVILKNKRVKPTNKYSGSDIGKIMNANDDIMFSPSDNSICSRNEDELKFVESAFKVAEEMDLLESNSSLIIHSDEPSTSGMYYTLPVMMDGSSTVIRTGKENEEFELSSEEMFPIINQKNKVVMAQPLDAVDADSSTAVEMLSM